MNIGVSSPSFCIEAFETMLERIYPNFEVWEIIGEYRHFLPDIWKDMADISKSYPMVFQLHLPFSDINLASVVPGARKLALEMVINSLDCAARVGIEKATLHAGSLSSITFRDRDWALDMARDSLEKIYLKARDVGMHISLENLPLHWMLGTTMDELVRLSEGFEPETWGFCYDIGHGHITGIDRDEIPHIERITNIHVHDNFGTNDAHLIPGMGEIDFARLSRELVLAGTDTVIFESRNLEEGIQGKRVVEKYFG